MRAVVGLVLVAFVVPVCYAGQTSGSSVHRQLHRVQDQVQQWWNGRALSTKSALTPRAPSPPPPPPAKDVCFNYTNVCAASCPYISNQCCWIATYQAPDPQKGYCNTTAAEKYTKGSYKFCCKAKGPIADPLFKDFQNHTFEFMGKASHIYNVLSHNRHQVNMKLATAGPRHFRTETQSSNGTFAEILTFQVDDTRVTVDITELGNMGVSVGNEDFDLNEPFTHSTASANISFDPYVPHIGEMVVIASDLFKFQVVGVRAFLDKESGFNRGHLDLTVELKALPENLGGVLGSSFYSQPKLSQDANDFSFHDQEERYELEDLFSRPNPTVTTAQRRRLIEGLNSPHLTFPVAASLKSLRA